MTKKPEESGHISGITVIAHISGNLGLGVAARNILRVLLRRGIPVQIFDVDPGLGRGKHDLIYEPLCIDSLNQSRNLVYLFLITPPSIRALQGVDEILGNDRFLTVTFPMWELPTLSVKDAETLSKFDVIVSGTQFIRSACDRDIEGVFNIYADYPFFLPEDISANRGRYALPPDHFLFYTSFEPISDPNRKNPLDAVRAFQKAFPSDKEKGLVIKINNPRRNGGETYDIVKALQEEAGKDERVRLIMETMEYPDVLSLVASCDAFVSLHRAEGLGLGLMEAMSLGKPVIATAWSGNMSYMNYVNSCLVRYRLVPVEAEHSAYKHAFVRDAVWAAPDIADAANWMLRLAEEPDLAAEIGRRAGKTMALYVEKTLRGDFIDEIMTIAGIKAYAATTAATESLGRDKPLAIPLEPPVLGGIQE